MKKLIALASAVAVVVVAAYVMMQYNSLAQWLVTPKDDDGHAQTVTVEIPSGASVLKTLYILVDAGLIDAHPLMKYLHRVQKDLPAVKAGEYELASNHSPLELLHILAKGTVKLYAITIPEGLRIEEIAQIFEKEGHGSAQEVMTILADPSFLKRADIPAGKTESYLSPAHRLEGYLMPETYKFPKGYSLRKKLAAMVEGYHKVVGPKEIARAKELGLTEHQLVTLASIVEKETGVPQERPLIAAVFLNRLKKGMLLQTDPTVIYGLVNFNGNITRKDLQNPHPYNTYVHKGLPPGPIANPGKEAIQAVLHPAETPYLYFVSMNNGTHKFSVTYAEHAKAVREYQIKGKVGP